MKTLTPITSATYSYGTDPYAVADYVDTGYFVDLDVIRCRFRYENELVEFLRGPQYPAFNYQFIAPEEKSAASWPVTFAPVVIQAPFNFIFPDMTDAELVKLRAFMLSVMPFGSPFTFYDIGNGKSFVVRFASHSIKVKHQILGHNEVTLSLVRA